MKSTKPVLAVVISVAALTATAAAQTNEQCRTIRLGVVNMAESRGLMLEALYNLSAKRLLYPLPDGNPYAEQEMADYKEFQAKIGEATNHADPAKEQALIRVLNELCPPLN